MREISSVYTLSCTTKNKTGCVFKTVPKFNSREGKRNSDVISLLKKQEVIILTVSVYNTSVNPVRKPNGKGWCFTRFTMYYNLIISVAPVVPNVLAICTAIPSHHKYFTVIDLYSALFCFSVHEETQKLFAFT